MPLSLVPATPRPSADLATSAARRPEQLLRRQLVASRFVPQIAALLREADTALGSLAPDRPSTQYLTLAEQVLGQLDPLLVATRERRG